MTSAALEPEWLSAAAEAEAPGSNEQLLSIDCSSPGADCDVQQVMSFPSIFLLQLDKPALEYRGPRRAAAMLHFVARKARPIVSEGLDAEALARFKTADETVFIAYVGEDRAAAEMFADAARAYSDEFTFGTVIDSGVIETQGMEPPAVVCYKLVDGDTAVLKEIKGAHELDAWIMEASRPVLGELTVLNQKRLLDRGFPMVYLFAETESHRQRLRKTLYKFARNYYDSLTSVVVDPFQFPELMAKLGLEPGVFPAGAVHQLFKDRIYPYPKGRPFSANAVQQWGMDVYQGRIKPWTPPGVTTTYEDLGPTRAAARKVSIPSIPGVKIKIAGHDEL
ncbi:hypothetical protein MFIFM68171_10690 [Madurella fahalii]|uniref:protein disulfide-isomerase n=1 Tax=Madurella fahalii TaxID=1157608 RepID=A0ABQ0GRW4_9PEZI